MSDFKINTIRPVRPAEVQEKPRPREGGAPSEFEAVMQDVQRGRETTSSTVDTGRITDAESANKAMEKISQLHQEAMKNAQNLARLVERMQSGKSTTDERS